ncbi:IS3 family transposase [Moraxella lacunata]|uniref:IS3 family transposase n=1 Tax=Moraxella lacunata TaxID=477 RepID=UPI0015F07152
MSLKEQIKRICYHHKGRYGYRRITLQLNNQLSQKGMVITQKSTNDSCKRWA